MTTKATSTTDRILALVEGLRQAVRAELSGGLPVAQSHRLEMEIACDRFERAWKVIQEARRLAAEGPPKPEPTVRGAGAKS
jgi:hypothetical protein